MDKILFQFFYIYPAGILCSIPAPDALRQDMCIISGSFLIGTNLHSVVFQQDVGIDLHCSSILRARCLGRIPMSCCRSRHLCKFANCKIVGSLIYLYVSCPSVVGQANSNDATRRRDG